MVLAHSLGLLLTSSSKVEDCQGFLNLDARGVKNADKSTEFSACSKLSKDRYSSSFSSNHRWGNPTDLEIAVSVPDDRINCVIRDAKAVASENRHAVGADVIRPDRMECPAAFIKDH
jgi:hypothetical protein